MVFVRITYFVHGSTIDNENHIATGCADGELSKKGITETVKLKELIKGVKFHAVFCSDLKRAVDSANILFDNGDLLIIDKRLRECDYGDLAGKPTSIVYPQKLERVTERFPNGESYKDVEIRMKEFLNFLIEKYPEKHVAIVAHQAPQLALDVIIRKRTWEQAIKEDWRNTKSWKPGWEYVYERD